MTLTDGTCYDGLGNPYKMSPFYYCTSTIPRPPSVSGATWTMNTVQTECTYEVHVFPCQHCGVCKCGNAKLTG